MKVLTVQFQYICNYISLRIISEPPDDYTLILLELELGKDLEISKPFQL